MIFVRAFAGVLVSFFVIDLLWIGRVVQPMYAREVGPLLAPSPRLGAAAAFYLAYAAGVAFFAVRPALEAGGIVVALRNGAALGALAYGTYAFTNYAVLRGWTLRLVVADLAWGVVLTAITAVCGLLAARIGR